MFMNIAVSKDWKKVTPISKGWSSDKKYLVETADGKLQLLRISDIDAYEAKKKEYEIITKYSRLDSYFNDDVPEDFWTANAVYVAQASLFSIKWAEKFGQDEIDGMVRRARNSMTNFNDFKNTVPKWYSDRSDMK